MESDELAWLEDVQGEDALAWVHERSAEVQDRLTRHRLYDPIRAGIQEALDADDRIPLVTQVGDHLYGFWTDAEHERGLWRRTTWESYRTDDPQWEVVLDVDALAAEEGVAWVWHGAEILRPERDRALVTLSRGGSDADTTRELDLTTGEFVDGGFVRPESKGGATWVDRDTLLVHTDVGEGSMTRSGYPRTVRRWRRGQPLADAREVYAGEPDDMLVAGVHDHTEGWERSLVHRMRAFYDSQSLLLGPDDEVVPLDLPDSAEVQLYRQWLVVALRHDWTVPSPGSEEGTTHPGGALLVTEVEHFLDGSAEFTVLYHPDERSALRDWTWTRRRLVLTVLRDVRHEVRVAVPDGLGWQVGVLDLPVPELATVSVSAVDRDTTDDVWLVSTSWLDPMRLSLVHLDDPAHPRVEVLKVAPERFDATGLSLTQHWVDSADGTPVPYFLVAPDHLPTDGSTPTVLHGYGGFEQPLTPAYDPIVGRAWLAHGGAYAVAGIRGGGEFGPRWHQAALREHRHRAFDDFVAVARDLVARGVTTVDRLGVTGRSNGGLLVGNVLTGYPEDVGAVVCQVPLLDMHRYHRLLAGASWMAEYGDPDDPQQWEWLRAYSPYHRFDPDRPTPPVYLATSTRDDRVHPAHARKMAELLRRHDRDVTYWENTEGGHGGASTSAQWARWHALPWAFLHERLADA